MNDKLSNATPTIAFDPEPVAARCTAAGSEDRGTRRRRPETIGLGVAAMMVGLILALGTVAGNGFGRAAAADRLVEQAEPAIGREGIVKLRDDADLVIRVIRASLERAIPLLAAQVGTTPERFNAAIAEQFPNTALVATQAEEISGALDRTVSNLEAHRGDFADAAAIPLPGIDPIVLPAGALAVGVALVALGVVALRRPQRRVHLAIGLLGAALVAAPLAMALPHKLEASERIVGSLDSSQTNAERTRRQFDAARASVAEVRTGLLPAVAASLGVSDAELLGELVAAIPELEGLNGVDAALDNIEADVRFREQRRSDLASVQGLPFAAVSWLVIALGGCLAGAGLASWGRRR